MHSFSFRTLFSRPLKTPLVVSLAWAGLMGSPCLAADGDAPAKTEAPVPKDQKDVDPFAVPNTNDPQELLKFIGQVQRQRPTRPIKSYEDYQAHVLKVSGAIGTAADKILAAKPEEAILLQAARSKFMVLSLQIQMGNEKAQRENAEFAALLKKDSRPAVVELADSQLLMGRIMGVRSLKPNELQTLTDEGLNWLNTGGTTASKFQVISNLARALEFRDEYKLAGKSYRALKAAAEKSTNPLIKQQATRFDGSLRRMDLPGNPIQIEGVTVDGKKFDISEYKGKVVLVDFWATWCGPCVAELPNLKNLYAKYHKKGFEVVAISLDRDKATLEKFIKERQITWVNLYPDGKDGGAGWKNPLADRYGVSAIPTVILVDQSGKVISLRARGSELSRLLAKLLGPADNKPATE